MVVMTVLRLATYNVHKCVGPDGRRAPGRVLDVVNALEADVVALQEADRRLGARPAALPQRLVETMTDLAPVETGQVGPSLGWHGNAILLRHGLEVTAVEPLNLPGFEPRGALMVEIAAPIGALRIVAVHLGLMRRHRLRQLRAIRAALSRRPAMPTTVLGDFNEWSLTDGLEPLAQGFEIHSPGRSFHTLHPIGHLDRIALCRDLSLHDAGVQDTSASRRASDHLPVWADVKLAA